MERPIIKLVPAKKDILLDRISLFLLLLLWVSTIVQYFSFPSIIPIHFNLRGEIDNYGSKATLFILPVIITIVFAGLTVLNKYPLIFNYMKKITPENAREEYLSATRLLRIIKLIITFFVLLISIDIFYSVKYKHSKFGWWAIPVFMIAMILPIFISMYSSTKRKKNGM